MNSIFSSFDALCAEFLGQSVRPALLAPSSSSSSASTSTSTSTTNKDGYSLVLGSRSRGRSATTTESDEKMMMKKKKQQDGNVGKKQSNIRAPRFAPELDGLNCFETFVSY